MTAKEYLKQIELLENQVTNLCFELEEAESSISQIKAIRYDNVKVQNGTKQHEASFEKEIDRVIEIRDKLIAKIAEANLKRYEIISVLNELPNVNHSRLLFMLYVEHKTLVKCSEELEYSYDYTVELHRNALRSVKVPECRTAGSLKSGEDDLLAAEQRAESCRLHPRSNSVRTPTGGYYPEFLGNSR